jgi:hypothetical protein
MPIKSSNLDEIISSIQQLRSEDKPLYRRHLEELSSQLFHTLAQSPNQDAVMMTLLAAASCHHPLSRTLSRAFLNSSSPIVQLTAVQALAVLNTNEATTFLVDALRSDYPIVRLEAAWHIAQKKIPDAFSHLDALSYKLPAPLLSWMPELFAVEGSASSVHKLQQLLFSSEEQVIVETILAIGRHNISSFEDSITQYTSHSPATLEAIAFCLRNFDTAPSRNRLIELSHHQESCVRIQAALSLSHLGDTSQISQIIDLANQGNLFALFSLQDIDGIIPNIDIHSRTANTNLALSLLAKRQIECTSMLIDMLDLPEDEVIGISHSLGNSLSYLDLVQAATFPKEFWSTLYEQSLRLKESVLSQTIELPEPAFLAIARTIFSSGRIELYPCLIQLLENQRSEEIIQLLKLEATRVGMPYNRAFATLALMNIGIETDENSITSIIELAREKESQPWRFPLPWMVSPTNPAPQQHEAATSRLYIEAIDTLAQRASPSAIAILTEELGKAPMHLKPCIVAALLQATL